MAKEKRTKDWHKYPLGTKAYAVMGGYWIKKKCGWSWNNGQGGCFPTPGADAREIELPKTK